MFKFKLYLGHLTVEAKVLLKLKILNYKLFKCDI